MLKKELGFFKKKVLSDNGYDINMINKQITKRNYKIQHKEKGDKKDKIEIFL